MYKYVLAVICAVVFVSPATADFYVDQDMSTKECRVVETNPDGVPPENKATRMVSDQTFKTNEEAEAALKEIPECKQDD